MQALTEKILFLKPPNGLFNKTVVSNLFPSQSEGARKALIFKAMDKQEIIQIKPGLYCLESRYRENSPHLFVIAALLHNPSYVSMESALQYHGLIPEAVYQVRSVSQSRSRLFKTPFGYFQFYKIPCNNFRAGVKSLKVDKTNWAFVATPLRAIADLFYLKRNELPEKEETRFLTDSMRIEKNNIEAAIAEDFNEVYDSLNSHRVKKALLSLKKGF